MRRIWPGVAATARSSAISRSRCWIDRPSVLATTNIAMNIASPPNAAVTGIKIVRVSSSSGYSAAPRAPPVSTCAPPAAARRRADVEAGGGEHADRVDPARMPGQPRRLRVGQEDRRLLGNGMAGSGDADHRDRAGGLGGRQGQPRTERGGVAGDNLVGPCGRPSGAQDVRRQRGAAPAVGDNGPAAEPGRHRHVPDRRTDSGHGRQPRSERRAHPRSLAEQDIVVGAGLLLPGHDRRGAGVALNRRMRAQDGLELHAPGHREHGRGEERDQRAGERAETATSAENGETQHR